MKSIKLYTVFFSVLLVMSCKKDEQTFNHDSPEVFVPCTCCEISDTVSGIYIGRVLELQLVQALPTPIFDTITDSLATITVDRVFPSNSNPVYDSSHCHFLISDFFTDTLVMTDNSGVLAPGYYDHQIFQFNGELLIGNVGYAPNEIYWYYTWQFEGVKQ